RRRGIADDDAVALLRELRRHEAEGHVPLYGLDRPVEAILPAPPACGLVDEHVAGLYLDPVALRRQPLLRPVCALQQLRRALAGPAAEHSPRPGQPAVVVNRDLPRLEVDVALLDAVAAPVEA